MQFPGFTKRGATLQRIALWVGVILVLVSLGFLAYLGTFTRYLADDYCEATQVTQGPVINAVLHRYQIASDRYSNLLFVALSEFVSPHNVQPVPVAIIILWTAALIWLVREVKRLAGLNWPLPADLFIGSMLAFFPIFEAPNLFQTVFWRSGMATHFAPLVYLAALTALVLLLLRRGEGKRPGILIGLLLFVLAFFGGGFSEPPDAMLVVASSLAMVAVWIWEKTPRRAAALGYLAAMLGGGLLALLVMKFSPANAIRLGTPPPQFPVLISRTIVYSFQFIWDSLATLPLPTLLSIITPAVLFYSLAASAPALSSRGKRSVLLLAVVTPILMYVLLAASFAPSVYGQAYPVERARFSGRLMMTTAAIIEGACLGVFLAQRQPLRSRSLLVNLASLSLVILAIYPVRGALTLMRADVVFSQKWAAAWDARQALIYTEKAQGQQNIVVRQLPGIEHVKELDTRATFWVNRCAAQWYGVQSISAPQQEYLR